MRWQAPMRVTTKAGLRLFGPTFRGGLHSSIRRSQITTWEVPYFPGDFVLLVTRDTAELFAPLGPTLGWERHARSVRVVPIEGTHDDYMGPVHGPSFAARLLDAALQAPVSGNCAYYDGKPKEDT